jgi:hypothetical protein
MPAARLFSPASAAGVAPTGDIHYLRLSPRRAASPAMQRRKAHKDALAGPFVGRSASAFVGWRTIFRPVSSAPGVRGCRTARSRIRRAVGQTYTPAHDTGTNTRKRTGNPIAPRSLDRCDAARPRRACAQPRLNPPDEPQPASRCMPQRCAASGPAQRDERHPATGNSITCPARQFFPCRSIPLRLAPAKQVEASAHARRPRDVASTAFRRGRWIARPCAQDGATVLFQA